MLIGERSEKFVFLDSLRGLASLWVVFAHTTPFLLLAWPDLPAFFRVGLVEHGGLGVIVFFAISGFVISYSLRSTAMDARGFGNFMSRRLVRLAPPYYAAVVLALVIQAFSALVKNESWAMPGVGDLVAHALFLPDMLGRPLINGVYWTLYLEVALYILLGCAVWAIDACARRSQRLGVVVMGVVGVAALINPLFELANPVGQHYLRYILVVGAYAFPFVLGVYTQWFRSGRLPRWMYSGYLAALVISFVAHRAPGVGVTLVTGAVLYAAIRSEGGSQWLRQRPFRFLGRISYSLYLVHTPILGATYYAATKIIDASPAVEVLLLIPEFAASLVVASLTCRLIEAPSIRWSRRLRRTPARQGSLAQA